MKTLKDCVKEVNQLSREISSDSRKLNNLKSKSVTIDPAGYFYFQQQRKKLESSIYSKELKLEQLSSYMTMNFSQEEIKKVLGVK